MKHKEMSWKTWLTVIIIVAIIGGIASGMRASAESTTPSDLPVVDDEETYWLDEVEGVVILDDPAYFMDFAEEEEPDAEARNNKGEADAEPVDSSVVEGTGTPTTDDESATDSPDVPATDESVTEPAETPDTPSGEPNRAYC